MAQYLEGSKAILLVGDDEQPLDVSRSQLPANAREGQHIQVELQGNQVIHVQIDDEATQRAQRRIEEKLNRLRRGDHLK